MSLPKGIKMKVFCFANFYALISLATATCSNGWMRYDDSCYFFEDIKKEPWHVAYNYCSVMDANLVKIESQRENNFLVAEIKKLHPDPEGQFWTAGNDIQVEKDWVWAGTNENISEFTDWTPGEPNSGGGTREEDCLTIYPRQGYHWNDEHCDRPMNYICEHWDPQNGGEIVG